MATIITNKTGLPEEFYRATQYDGHYSAGDISVTQLIDAPQVRMLKKQHDVEKDVTDMIWALFGTAVHYVLEKSQYHNHKIRTMKEAESILAEAKEIDLLSKVEVFTKSLGQEKDEHIFYEKTMTVEVDGMLISGTMDKFNTQTGVLEDYKVSSVYNYIFPEAKQKWEAQQNVYAYILRENGYDVKSSQITAIFRDFSGMKAKTTKNYPKYPIENIKLKLYPHKKIHEYIQKRIHLHRQAEKGNVAECSFKERWATADTFAAMKKGGKRSMKNFIDKLEAEKFIEANSHKYDGLWMETRKGENKRCDSFCDVRDVCPQRKAFLN